MELIRKKFTEYLDRAEKLKEHIAKSEEKRSRAKVGATGGGGSAAGGPDVKDELSFPKNAEVREVETKNSDWCLGVYAGNVGLFPRNHVRVL